MRSEGIRQTIEHAFARYGAAVTVEHGEERTASRGFLQPLAQTEGEPFSVEPLGAVDTRSWRYLGSADCPVAQGDRLVCAGRRYRVRRAERVCMGESVTHYRAVVDREEETE